MTQDAQTVEEIVEKFQRRFGNSAPRIAMRSPDDCTELAEWLRATLTKVAEEARKEERERIEANAVSDITIAKDKVEQIRNDAVREERERLARIIRSRLPDPMTDEEMEEYHCEGSVLYWGSKLLEQVTNH